MIEAILSLLAGLLSVLAPCVLPLLPIIIGGSLRPNASKYRPYIIAGSLVVSLILFTLILKVSTALIGVDPRIWPYISGTIVILLGLSMLFPQIWDQIIGRAGLQAKSQELLGSAGREKNELLSAVFTGFALGPVFSSCSPTYAWVIATVLPKDTLSGIIYLVIYCLGVAVGLLAIALFGRHLLAKIKWASDPKGWFQRAIAILFILVGLFLFTGWDKQAQTWLVDKDVFGLGKIEDKLVPDENKSNKTNNDSSFHKNEVFNIEPYTAPEFIGLDNWINSDQLTIDELKGKVVLIDFWTYSCINCIRTLPYVQKWYDTYKDDGLVIVGVHAPEFAFERVPKNVENFAKENKLTYPIALDNDFATWSAYQNQFWPAHYLIDRSGQVRREHFGEGEYDITEKAIRELLSENGSSVESDMTVKNSVNVPISRSQTPETYLGSDRAGPFASSAQDLAKNQLFIDKNWSQDHESITSTSETSTLSFNVSAKKVFLVAGSVDNIQRSIKVSWDGQDKGEIKVSGSTLYTILSLDEFSSGILKLQVPSGVKLNAFTFES